MLIGIQEVSAPAESAFLNLPYEHIACRQWLSLRESDLLSLKRLRGAFAKAKPIFCPVVDHKFFLTECVAVVVIFNEERRIIGASHQLGDFFVVELQEVREGTGEE